MDSAHAMARVEADGKCIEVEQRRLETVIPLVGKAVIVCEGKHKGARGTMETIDEKEFCVAIKLRDSGDLVTGLPYEAVCKYDPY